MSGGIRDEGGTGVALRPRPVEQSGKFSSILAYLDHVSDDVSRQHRGQRINDRETGLLGSGSSSSPSSISSSEQEQRRRRPRQQPRGPSQSSYRRKSGVSRVSAAGTRAPWNNSVKDDKTPTATSSAPLERSTRRASGGNDLSGPPVVEDDLTDRDHQNSTTSTPSARSRPSQLVVDHRRSGDVRGGFLSDANRVAGGVDWSNIDDSVEEALDDRSTTGSEAATATVGGKAQRQRWVWDEWDDNEAGSSTASFVHATAVDSSRGSKQPVAPRLTKTSPCRATHSSFATPDETSHPALDRARLSTWARDKDRATADADGGEGTPAAMKAFEDVQATALAMKANLKERRSEVC